MQLKHVLLICLVLIGANTFAQISFEASVSKTKLGVNERLSVEFTMNKDGDNFNPPEFTGFRKVGGPYQSVSQSWINGKSTYKKSYKYFLEPTATGNFTIQQAVIDIEGTTYKTTPIKITVTNAVENPTDGNNASVVADDNIHLVAEVSKTNPYLNEGVTVTYKLYVSPSTSVSNWREIASPKYADFWSQSIDIKQLKVQNGTYQGEQYRYVTLRKTVLYPQKSGKLEIEPLSLSIDVDVPSNRRDIFGGRLFETVKKNVSAGKRIIDVKPLPTEGKPSNFTNAVGKFNFEVTTNKTELEATESLDAVVKISGNGNLSMFNFPELVVPSSLEVFEPQRKERVSTTVNGMRGSVEETYTIIPNYKGKYPISPISFSYFDLETETYKTITSKEIVIDVLSGPENTGNATATGVTSGNNKQAVVTTGTPFRFIKQNANLKPIGDQAFFKSIGFWILLVGPLALIPLAIIFGKKREERANDVRGNRIRKADKLARKYLSDAKKKLGDQKPFYESLERALHNYLKAKLNIQTSEMSKDRIQRLLKERGADEASSIEYISLLENCEFARYTPSSNTAMQQDYDKASRIISQIDKQM